MDSQLHSKHKNTPSPAGICAVLGHPIKHSASPAMHNAAIEELGLNWRYLAFDVLPERLSEAIEGARAMGFIGLNLTVPHKLLAVPLMDILDDSARQWGAVNTVRFEGKNSQGDWIPLGQLGLGEPLEVRTHGFNTDAEAIVKSIESDAQISISGSKILLLGAGGAGRVAALKFAASGVRELFLINRTESKAQEIEREIRLAYPDVKVSTGYPTGAIDLLVNATSLGLREDDPLPFDRDRFSISQAAVVYDMIYRPAKTPLLCLAETAGCRVINGLGMLLFQGARALEIWSGMKAPVETMRAALIENIYGVR